LARRQLLQKQRLRSGCDFLNLRDTGWHGWIMTHRFHPGNAISHRAKPGDCF
jgi:hypothetical protein